MTTKLFIWCNPWDGRFGNTVRIAIVASNAKEAELLAREALHKNYEGYNLDDEAIVEIGPPSIVMASGGVVFDIEMAVDVVSMKGNPPIVLEDQR